MNRLDELKIKHKGENNMNIQQAKELLPIIQAFTEGRTIQTKNGAGWIDIDEKDYLNIESIAAYPDCFRIKPEPKYRPFANADECWQEMQKHQPFGWIKASRGKFLIRGFNNNVIAFGIKDNWQDYNYIFKSYTFADGTPFGIKEE